MLKPIPSVKYFCCCTSKLFSLNSSFKSTCVFFSVISDFLISNIDKYAFVKRSNDPALPPLSGCTDLESLRYILVVSLKLISSFIPNILYGLSLLSIFRLFFVFLSIVGFFNWTIWFIHFFFF